MEAQSGVTWGEVQAAMARVNIGDNPPELEKKVCRSLSVLLRFA